MEVFALCQHYGLAVDQKEQEVVLSRTAFKREAPMVSPSINPVSVRISFFGYCRRDGNAMQKCRSGEGVGASYVFGAMQILIRYLHLACFDIVDFFRDSRDSQRVWKRSFLSNFLCMNSEIRGGRNSKNCEDAVRMRKIAIR
jgi:hypothetical protein